MSKFAGWYFRIRNNYFNNPLPKREAFQVMPRIVQVTDAGRVASGKLLIKELPHRPTKLNIEFPIMTPKQFQDYYKDLDDMYLPVDYYDESRDMYVYGSIMYHNDIIYRPVIYQGQRMILFEPFSLIEH